MNEIEKQIFSLRNMAELLIPYTYPLQSMQEEQKVLCMKQRYITIDGYELFVCFSIGNYDNNIIETLQIQSKNCSFLPFTLVCKVGKMFMGDSYLGYIEFFKFNKKIYCWAVKKVKGKKKAPSNASKMEYEGFNFYLLNPIV